MTEVAPRLVRVVVAASAALGVCAWARAADIAIVYTGETHALVTPCDCPISKDGGVARRKTAIDAIRRGGLTPTLLLDAGGQFGGSAYDEYTNGPTVDRERTRVHLRACAKMGYAAYAVGDEELQWGPEFLREAVQLGAAPFVSANLSESAARAVGVERYIITKVGALTVGVTAATPQDTYALGDPLAADWAQVGDPETSVREVVSAIRDRVDLVIVLSHLGTDRSSHLAAAVPGIDIIVNAHYKRAGGLVSRVGETLVCEFNMEARALSCLDLTPAEGPDRAKKRLKEYRLREIPLDPSVPDDPELGALVADYQKSAAAIPGPRMVLDYYTAWGCGYCEEFDPKLAEALQSFGPERVVLRRWFVSHPNPQTGELESMFGPDSIAESRRQVAVAKLYGADALGRYVQLRHLQPQGDPFTIATSLGFDAAALKQQAQSDETTRVLRVHAERCTRFHVTGTPTLYVNNLEYAGDMETPALLRTLCWELPEALRGEPCKGVPECAHNGHCRKQPGKIGICVDAGTGNARCEYRDPPPLKLLVLTSDDVRLANSRALVGDLRSLLPGLAPENVPYGSDVGSRLAALGKVRWLPAFFFPTAELEQRPNLSDLAEGLTKLGDYYMVLPEHTSAGLDVTRERHPGQVDLFYRPYLPAALDAVTAMLSVFTRPEVGAHFKLDLHAMLMRGPKGELSAEGGVAEIEEAARQTVIWRDHPDAMLRYVALRRQAGNSSYWDVPIRMAGLEPDEIRKAATDRAAMDRLYADAQMREDLGVWGECVLMNANQELADISAPGRANEVADRLGLAPSSVTVLFTGSANGQLEACRCPGNPYGGLSRQAGAVSELRDLYRANVLVDSGNVFAERPDQARFTYQLRALDSFRYDAVAIGDQDFAYGIEALRGLATASGIPFASSNMTLPGVEPRAMTLERGGAKVGVISLTSPRAFAFREGGVPSGVTIADPVETARRLVPDLRSKCSVVVALFHGYLDDARDLAAAVPELNVIVCGHEGVALQAPEQVGATWLVAPGRNGEWVGRLTFHLDETGAVTDAEPQMIAMDDSIVPEPAVEKIVADYENDVQTGMRNALNVAKVDGASKPESCAQCHQAEYDQWKTTRHASAAATLRALQREFDPDCWSCHSSLPLAGDAARLPDVSCVACHRMAEPSHAGHKALEPLTPQSCLPCHTEGKSPHFDPATYMPRVVHRAPAG